MKYFIQIQTLNDIESNDEDPILVVLKVNSIISWQLLPGQLLPGVEAPIRLSYIGKIHVFENYSYSIGIRDVISL